MKVPANYENIPGGPSVNQVSTPELQQPFSILEKPAEQSTQLPPELMSALRKYAVKKENLPPQLQALVQMVENK